MYLFLTEGKEFINSEIVFLVKATADIWDAISAKSRLNLLLIRRSGISSLGFSKDTYVQ